MDKFKKINILIPLYNDWESLKLLIDRTYESINDDLTEKFFFTVINDCSNIEPDEKILNLQIPLEIIHLNRNIGHQKAIAIGLAYIAKEENCDAVIVMDSDGEDKPEDIKHLINLLKENSEKIIFARRIKRQENIIFKFFYNLYKFIFLILTGKTINFGNFCIMTFKSLKKVVYISEIWNHFASGIIYSSLNYISFPVERGKRIAGQSRMNFNSLILHGLSSVSVHIDVVAVRLITITLTALFISFIAILIVISVRLFTDLAIPGWATTTVIGFTIIFIQSFLLILFLAFTVLTNRTQKKFIPALDYEDYILEVQKIKAI